MCGGSTVKPENSKAIQTPLIGDTSVKSSILAEHLTDRWKHRRKFLGLPKDDWPNKEFTADQSEVEKE